MTDKYEHCVCDNKDPHFYPPSAGRLNVYNCDPDDISDNVVALKKRVEKLAAELKDRVDQVESLQQLLDECVVAVGSLGVVYSDLPNEIGDLLKVCNSTEEELVRLRELRQKHQRKYNVVKGDLLVRQQHIIELESERDAILVDSDDSRVVCIQKLLDHSSKMYADLTDKLGNKCKHINKLESALTDLLGCGELPCSIIHHESKDQHEVGEDCPILVRYRGLIEERRQDD